MAIAVQHTKECCLVLMQGQIEASDCSFLKDILRLASLSRNKNIWVDCEYLASVSAEALRKMHSLAAKAKSTGVNLLFYQMPPAVRKAAEESGADTELHIVSSIADASRYCREKKAQRAALLPSNKETGRSPLP